MEGHQIYSIVLKKFTNRWHMQDGEREIHPIGVPVFRHKVETPAKGVGGRPV